MDFSIERDGPNRYVCTLNEGEHPAVVTASNVPEAGEEMLAALGNARADGYGECMWDEQGGDYRWMLRRDGGRLTLVVLWSSGVITGWQHVFRTDCDFDWFDARMRAELARVGVASGRVAPGDAGL